MRVTSSLLAAGFAASALAAPGARHHRRAACPDNSTPASTTSSSAAPSSTPTTNANASAGSSSSSASGGLKFLGTSESGAEFGEANYPGTYGKDYIFPDTSAIQTLIDMGMNMFRIPFLAERMAQSSLSADLDADYLKNLTTVVNYITEAGKYAVIEPHNYARYKGNIISSTADFETFWTNLATSFKTNDKVVFDCINEPHDMTTDTQTAELNQACVDGVRGAGATSQYIFVEGTSYTGAWTWTTSGNSEHMGNITDSVDNLLVYEMHQYLDSDGSGTSTECVSTTIGEERITAATTWLRENNKIGIIGEFAGGDNTQCKTAVTGMLDYMTENSDVWIGAMWWAAGPWWADYMYSMEPSTGTGYTAYKDILSKYVPA
ncbi:endo-beta-glucanase precursor [Diaporthe amygdali]|uniref:endo-beta-glucanase precursor n=1 Tax=Phomopsis amygdali TaxID=1214568 RepID=UPI0022FDE1E0|nr:endo-beta-glucanase precursor [Diaporthe amygdali]KAJ0114851.1 endo-beta-glucanase precursor [Diaporthe amygdali]